MKAELIDGSAIGEDIKAEVARGVEEMRTEYGIVPTLAAVLVGDHPASSLYVRNKEKAATAAGMRSEIFRLPGASTQQELLCRLDRLNLDPKVHGILVQLPLPAHINEEMIIEGINPEKDVDGLHPLNVGLLVAGKPRFISATPAGIQEMLLRSGYDPEGKHVVVCGRSNIVGKPISNLLVQRLPGANATVTVCHSKTQDLPDITRRADILIAAIGQARFITADMVSEGVVVIDVGINRIDAPDRKRGYRIVGDVDFDTVSEKAAAITPVPGGVGPMTIAMLLNNTLLAARFTLSRG